MIFSTTIYEILNEDELCLLTYSANVNRPKQDKNWKSWDLHYCQIPQVMSNLSSLTGLNTDGENTRTSIIEKVQQQYL